tara:strand:+ start:144 stop:866 length:723 start_codon:yes stop_codon:yes gene_type:complete
MKGYILALFEIFIFFYISKCIKLNSKYQNISSLIYYWCMFTVLTGLWELFFITNYRNITLMSENLLKNNTHVWTNEYSLENLIPNKFSYLFYSEYGAYADREYMDKNQVWSRVIEGSHCLICGLFCLIGFIYQYFNNNVEFYISIGIAMGSQLMNSILYLFSYFYQMKDSNSVNYCSLNFECGNYLSKRLFMYVNVFWFIMPFLILIKLGNIYVVEKNLKYKNKSEIKLLNNKDRIFNHE